MLGWSGSKTIERDLREYIKGAHELRDGVAWGHVPDQKPIVGRRGWDVTPSGARGNLVFGRELHIEQDEHWFPGYWRGGVPITRARKRSEPQAT